MWSAQPAGSSQLGGGSQQPPQPPHPNTNTKLPSAPDPAAAAGDSDVSIAADVFGHTAHLDGLAAKVDAGAALAEVRTALAAIPATEKVALVQAQGRCPASLDDGHVLRFLWAENFVAADAARRLARYWNDRYRLFGPEKFCLPLTLKGALKDDSLALSRGYVQLLPEPDTAGRAVVYVDWSSHEPSVGYTEESMHRVFWYMIHVAMEDSTVLQRGVVMLIYPQEARLDQFDHSLWSSISDSCRRTLPLRWRSTHVVHPNRFFSIIHPVFMYSLPKDVQERVVVHSGTKMKVLADLLRYCLPWDRIPSEIGGCVDLDFEKWLSDRMTKEDQATFPKKPTMSAYVLGGISGSVPDPAASANGGQSALGNNVNQLLLAQATNGTIPFPLSNPPDAGPAGAKPTAARGPKVVVKSGRKSDPRMDRAVQAKLDDPSLPLLDALRAGGFVFPALDDSTTPQYTVVDADNVKITQRKNQLLRRIRTAKKKSG